VLIDLQVKIARKPFSLDPGLANMKDNITSTSKKLNWDIIFKELKVRAWSGWTKYRNSG